MKAVRPSSCSRGDSAVAGSWRGDQELSPGHQKPTSSIVHAVSLSRKAFCQLRGLEYFLITCRERAVVPGKPRRWCFSSACYLDPGPSHTPELHMCPAAPCSRLPLCCQLCLGNLPHSYFCAMQIVPF